MSARLRGERGFWLVETAAVCLVLMALSAMLLAYPMLNRERADYGLRTTAAYLAQEQIAHIEIDPGAYSGNVGWLGDGAEPLKLNGHEFAVRTTVSAAGSSASLRDISVTVTWTTADRRPQTYTLNKMVMLREPAAPPQQ